MIRFNGSKNKSKNKTMIISESGKLPPQAVEIEESVLGTMLQFPTSLVEVFTLLNVDSFYKPTNQRVFSAIKSLYESEKQIDLVTVVEKLRSNGELHLAGGPGHISGLTNKSASQLGVEQHCLILKEKQISRAQIAFAGELLKKAYDETGDVFESMGFMDDQVHKIHNISEVSKELTNEELASLVIKEIEKAAKNEGITGVPTGFKEKDKLFGGWQPTDLIIQAARPGMGKTANALCEAFNMAVLHDQPVAFFSLEMSSVQLFKRLTSLATRIDANKFRSGNMTNQDWLQFHKGIEQILTNNIIIIDDCYTLQEIRNKCKKIRVTIDLKAVYVDYLQIMQPGKKKFGTREQEISHYSGGLKRLAKEIKVPVIALCQLSRALEKRTNKRPILSDLREGGSLEQDADIVCFIHRPNYYGEAQPGEEQKAYFIVAKHRNGMLKDIELRYISNRTQFIDYDTDFESNDEPF